MSLFITLKENRDFRRLYRQSLSYVGPALVVYLKENRAGFSRIGITAGKKLGTAVKRNRAKRVIRVAYRTLLPDFKKNVDMVVVARKRATFIKSQEAVEELKSLLEKAEIIWFFMKHILIFLIKVYKKCISPFKTPCCRYYPTCSQYAIDAIKTHGAIKGSYYSIKRILRCNPFGKGGYDPVPPKISVKSRKK